MATISVPPDSVKICNRFCSRVVYIDCTAVGTHARQRGNIRKRLTREMQNLQWNPKPPESHCVSSFLFFKRSDAHDWNAENDVDQAIMHTKQHYPTATFQYAVLKPVTNNLGSEDGAEADLTALFQNMWGEEVQAEENRQQ